MEKENRQEYLNPYVSGVLIGITVTVFMVVFGQSINIANVFTKLMQYLDPKYGLMVDEKAYGVTLFIAFGMAIGAFFSALTNRRIQLILERGKICRKCIRLLLICLGGFLTSYGLLYAKGGILDLVLGDFSTLVTGGLIFILSFIISGYVVSFLFWGQWND